MKLCPICHGDVEAVGSFTACTCTVASLRSAAVGFRTKMDEANSSHHDALEQVETLTAECAKMRAEVTDLLLKRDALAARVKELENDIEVLKDGNPVKHCGSTLSELIVSKREVEKQRDALAARVAEIRAGRIAVELAKAYKVKGHIVGDTERDGVREMQTMKGGGK